MNHEETKKQVAIVGLSLAASIAVGDLITGLTTADQVLITLGLFTSFVLLDLLWLMAKLVAHQVQVHALWRVREHADGQLVNIRHHFAQIAKMSHGQQDLFVSHFNKEIEALARSIKDAAEKQELRKTSDFYIRAEDIFAAFLGDTEKVLRYTWPIRDAERLFGEPAWWRFFEVKARMIEQKTIKACQALLIVDSEDSLKLPRITRLLDYFKTKDGLDCRVIMRADFSRICSENAIPATYLDFGIYGTRMLFRSEQYEPDYIGLYTKDAATIQQYSEFFGTLWDSVVSKANPSAAKEIVSWTELKEFDDKEPLHDGGTAS